MTHTASTQTTVGDAQRVCFVLQLKPERVEDYLAAHTTVWPEMLDTLREAGWHNYSLFLRERDGMVVGYLETDDFARATARMEATAVNDRWQATMAGYFAPAEPGDSGANPDTVRDQLTEYFHLD
ncbi:L-rhamnose mutarotase [Gordonia amarae]|uniref:Putative L-rhamnose mutarotase n=1 Tax=Gordonia amarae NBRC 15530 TaxID=1075090 RepID=G7GLY5_9ACTN|nr:L-rhamnose mutarotase [Gordonia amarae]MCS3876459.1 L-rhamnose mutarotase [Gordonia amarae]QHN19370.1 L-rhamnose mutarotase [Gordonia amarae]QHN23846.1 L-rhamnose mutarotase [Gordonia amarae]QHN32756.1 L-rhamnose mutarotase [Gordonia amarae]GAB04610.1 putative L-rhamnose mutarotase [Gordonia amarae NBRC 15530]